MHQRDHVHLKAKLSLSASCKGCRARLASGWKICANMLNPLVIDERGRARWWHGCWMISLNDEVLSMENPCTWAAVHATLPSALPCKARACKQARRQHRHLGPVYKWRIGAGVASGHLAATSERSEGASTLQVLEARQAAICLPAWANAALHHQL